MIRTAQTQLLPRLKSTPPEGDRSPDPERHRSTELIETIPNGPDVPSRPGRPALLLVLSLSFTGLLLVCVIKYRPNVAATPPSSARIRQMVSATKRAELRDRARYDSFRTAVGRSNYEAAFALFAELPTDSIYYGKAHDEAQRARDLYLFAKLSEARTARRLGMCQQVSRLVTTILAIDATDEEARILDAKCSAAADGKVARKKKSTATTGESDADKRDNAAGSGGDSLRNPF